MGRVHGVWSFRENTHVTGEGCLWVLFFSALSTGYCLGLIGSVGHSQQSFNARPPSAPVTLLGQPHQVRGMPGNKCTLTKLSTKRHHEGKHLMEQLLCASRRPKGLTRDDSFSADSSLTR